MSNKIKQEKTPGGELHFYLSILALMSSTAATGAAIISNDSLATLTGFFAVAAAYKANSDVQKDQHLSMEGICYSIFFSVATVFAIGFNNLNNKPVEEWPPMFKNAREMIEILKDEISEDTLENSQDSTFFFAPK